MIIANDKRQIRTIFMTNSPVKSDAKVGGVLATVNRSLQTDRA
jgi:hypothetical protein